MINFLCLDGTSVLFISPKEICDDRIIGVHKDDITAFLLHHNRPNVVNEIRVDMFFHDNKADTNIFSIVNKEEIKKRFCAYNNKDEYKYDKQAEYRIKNGAVTSGTYGIKSQIITAKEFATVDDVTSTEIFSFIEKNITKKDITFLQEEDGEF